MTTTQERLADALRSARLHVAASAGAEHMMDGFGPRSVHPSDLLLADIDAALSAHDAEQPKKPDSASWIQAHSEVSKIPLSEFKKDIYQTIRDRAAEIRNTEQARAAPAMPTPPPSRLIKEHVENAESVPRDWRSPPAFLRRWWHPD